MYGLRSSADDEAHIAGKKCSGNQNKTAELLIDGRYSEGVACMAAAFVLLYIGTYIRKIYGKIRDIREI